MYAEMFDGLRSYYARYRSRSADAGFHAAATLSLICCVAVAAGVTVLDYGIARNIDWAVNIFQDKVALILFGVAVGYAHVWFGKRTGRYYCKDLSAPPKWKVYLTLYAALSAALFVGAVTVALL